VSKLAAVEAKGISLKAGIEYLEVSDNCDC